MKKSVPDSKMNHQQHEVKFTRVQSIIMMVVVFTMIIAGYLMLSLVSFDSTDPSWSQTSWNEPIHNDGGAIGAYLSDILRQFFGFVAYILPVIFIIIGIQAIVYFYRHRERVINYFILSVRTIGFIAFIFSATGFLALNVQDLDQFKAGGILGYIVAGEVLPFLGHIGTSLIMFFFALVCITLLTGLSWLFIAEMVGFGVVAITTPVFAFIANAFHSSQRKRVSDHLDSFDSHQTIQLAPTNDEQSLPLIIVNTEVLPQGDELKEVTINDQTEQDMTVSQSNDEQHLNNDNQLEKTLYQETELTIDENSLPNKINHQLESETPREHIINTDYYSPISLQIAEQSQVADVELHVQPQESAEIIDDRAILPTDDCVISEIATIPHDNIDHKFDESEVETQLESEPMVKITKENIHDSLIHPLLQKEFKPIEKPTTPLPSLNLLTAPPTKQIAIDYNALQATAALIEKSLSDFRVKARVVDYLPGPVITRFEIELAPGVKASRISTLDRDLARSLSMPSVRVVEVIPGKPYVGLELPNQQRQTVYFREVLDSPQFTAASSPLTIVLGKDIAGQSVVADLAKMPHLLVAGTTGSGKSVGVNAMILSILYKSQPEDVRFIMIDPKMLELSVYEGIPHLLTDVVTDMKDACNALNWCVNEMEKRYRLMSSLGVRNIAGYNDKIKLANEMGRPIPDPLWRPGDSMDIDIPVLEKLPYIVVLVDEFADLIMAVGKKVEELIARLAQKARAAGIHLVLATQRPSVDVITGLIKANIPTRIAFTVSSKIDSRTILDQMGAESLLGMGDMLFLAPNSSIPIRVHGAFVRDEEVHAVVQDWKARGIPAQYIENITVSSDEAGADGFDNSEEDLDPLFDQVVAFVVDKRRASISSVQRQFRIGYNRAARIVEQMELQGIVSAPNHSGNREVLAPPSGQDY